MTTADPTPETLAEIHAKHIRAEVPPCDCTDRNCPPKALCGWCDDEWPCHVAVVLDAVTEWEATANRYAAEFETEYAARLQAEAALARVRVVLDDYTRIDELVQRSSLGTRGRTMRQRILAALDGEGDDRD